MAIYFEIKLSSQAIHILFGLADWINKGRSMKDGENEIFGKFPHFIMHGRQLQREGLITSGPNWTITNKGRLMMELLKEEFEELRKQYKEIKPTSITSIKGE